MDCKPLERQWLSSWPLLPNNLTRPGGTPLVGSQHIIPPIQGEDLKALYQLAQRWFEKESH